MCVCVHMELMYACMWNWCMYVCGTDVCVYVELMYMYACMCVCG